MDLAKKLARYSMALVILTDPHGYLKENVYVNKLKKNSNAKGFSSFKIFSLSYV